MTIGHKAGNEPEVIAAWNAKLQAAPVVGPAIGCDGNLGWSHVIHFSRNLCEWRIADRMRA